MRRASATMSGRCVGEFSFIAHEGPHFRQPRFVLRSGSTVTAIDTDKDVPSVRTAMTPVTAFQSASAGQPANQSVSVRTVVGEAVGAHIDDIRSEEHTSELQSLMRISYAFFCLKKK